MSELTDLLERFRRGPELIAVATTGASGAQLDCQPAPGKWGVRQIVCHLADMELAAAVRFRQILAEENPVLGSYDPDAWTNRLGYEKRRFSQALESFRRLRAENYLLLNDRPGKDFSRMATHPKRGSMTLLDVLRLYAEHAEKHAQQIMKVRQKYRESKAKD